MAEAPLRTFLAVELPEEVRRGIEAVEARLRARIRGDLRWVKPAGVHLTLRFFGDLVPGELVRLVPLLEAAAGGQRPLRLTAGGLGLFPDPRRPRVLWLGLGGDVTPLIAFQQAVERALAGAGIAPEARPFRPHLTLARIRDPRGVAGLTEALARGAEMQAGAFVADGMALFRSELTPGGAIYTRLHHFPLAGGGNGRDQGARPGDETV